MKYEWRKQEKEIYGVKNEATLVDIKKASYICIDGKGNPNSEDFVKRIEVLYKLSYAVKMMPKNGNNIDGYFDYTVYPLEGLWSLTEDGCNKEFDKNELLYTIMIKQPSFITEDIFKKAMEITKKKFKSDLLANAYYSEIEDGLSVQILHHGSYDDEPYSFNKMKEFIKENNLKIKSLIHREIYLSDSRKVERDKLNTILRYRVMK